MKQQPLFKQTLLDLINVKPCNADAFRQGQTWANEKRRLNMTVRKTTGMQHGQQGKGCGESGQRSVITKGI